ncbi:MAG: 23S rRNA (uracil(1939)-C(5))-methyltransferase RlmD [Anaerococcus sp.]|nr:23S rRNA (uracil(1939)-C(5))-methyltransferase RlmD [Anaerococcus sp.]
MRKKQIKDINIEKMKYPNISQGHDEKGRLVEFKGGILGQRVRVKSQKKSKDKIKAKYLDLLEYSTLENNSYTCANPDICGGCSYQRLAYETELMVKVEMIKDLFREKEIAYKGDIKINQAPKKSAYRNKMEYTFGDRVKGGELILGLHRQNRFYEIVPPKACNIVDNDFNTIRSEVEMYFREKKTSFYHKNTKEGLLRHLIVRKAHRTGEIMVILVTTSDDSFDKIRKNLFLSFLLQIKTEGNIVSVFHVVNDSVADAVKVEKLDHLYGKKYISEEMLGLSFNISPFSFFQPNIFSAEKLYQKAFDLAGVDESMDVLDLYSGTGTITQVMASKAKSATGIEIVEEAVDKAFENAKLNDISNIDFLCGDVLKEIEKVGDKFDLVVLDPPRAGISPLSLEKILKIKTNKFIYISCNPKSQVDNFKDFLQAGFKIKEFEIFDQFPRSRHVETIALIQKM